MSLNNLFFFQKILKIKILKFRVDTTKRKSYIILKVKDNITESPTLKQ